jgi:hypothetical protein
MHNCCARPVCACGPCQSDLTRNLESASRTHRERRRLRLDGKHTLSYPTVNTRLPLLFQALNRPRLRYAAMGLYSYNCYLYIGSNSIKAAVELANMHIAAEVRPATATRPGWKERGVGCVIIGSSTSVQDHGPLLECDSRRDVFCYEVCKPRRPLQSSSG